MNVVVAGGGGVRLHTHGPRTEQDRSHPGGPGPHVSCLSSLLFNLFHELTWVICCFLTQAKIV
jgi:hypothetical protein